jgi:hypothetical protein
MLSSPLQQKFTRSLASYGLRYPVQAAPISKPKMYAPCLVSLTAPSGRAYTRLSYVSGQARSVFVLVYTFAYSLDVKREETNFLGKNANNPMQAEGF